MAEQAIANKFRSIYNIEYELNISYERNLKPWTEVFIERKLNLLSIDYKNESPFKRCAVNEIFELYSKFLLNLNDNKLRPVLNDFLYDGGAKKVNNFYDTAKFRFNLYLFI